MRKLRTIALAAAVSVTLLSGCTHTYTLNVQGVASPGSKVTASYWAQPRSRATPRQLTGRSTVADAQGRFTVESRTVLDFAGPPNHVVLEVDGLGPFPLCVILPTDGVWQDEERVSLTLPALQAMEGPEPVRKLVVGGLKAPAQVVRRNPDEPSCVAPGDK